MAVSVLTRPKGYTLSGSEVSVGLFWDTTSVYLFATNHAVGRATGDIVYIKSEIENYNGFKLIEKVSDNSFRIKELTGSYITFHPDSTANVTFGDCTYYATVAHNWNAVHLPIVYQLSNTLWPTNSADTVRDISSVADASGYCAIVAAADIKTTGSAAALEFVKITGCDDENLNGVWQIIAYTNDTTFTISLPYSSDADTDLTTNGSIQYYYNNYHIKAQVWGGLNNGHVYYAQEPYELLATLDLIPDENNRVKFSISEILKDNIAIKNNLLLGTLPNNLDAWTGFFIKYAEVYDDSNGTDLEQITATYTSDLSNFEGKAVNAKLPFKNVYSGAMSEYASENDDQKFLSVFTRPTLFSGKYFDLSFIWDGVQRTVFQLEWYVSGVLQTTSVVKDVDNFYTGVYRVQISDGHDCEYDRVDVTVKKELVQLLEVFENVAGSDTDWTEGAAPSVSLSGASQSDTLFADMTGSLPTSTVVTLYYDITVSGGPFTGLTATLSLTQASGLIIRGDETIVLASGSNVGSVQITITGTAEEVSVKCDLASGSATVTLNSLSSTNGDIVSETKTIDIDCKCLKAQATGYYLSWMNYLGGFDYWYFKGYTDNILDITATGETEENTFGEWPDSYGEFADTIRKQTFRDSREQRVIRSEHITEAQLESIKYIRTSPLVQIVNSIYDRRTVLVDSDSFTYHREEDKLFTISFTITYTDDVPSQRV